MRNIGIIWTLHEKIVDWLDFLEENYRSFDTFHGRSDEIIRDTCADINIFMESENGLNWSWTYILYCQRWWNSELIKQLPAAEVVLKH